jgi:hypothetical protein
MYLTAYSVELTCLCSILHANLQLVVMRCPLLCMCSHRDSAAAAAPAAVASVHHCTTTARCSYYDIMLAPIADALRDSLAAAAAGEFLRSLPGQKRPHVYFAMQVGAQGAGKGEEHCISPTSQRCQPAVQQG